MKTDIRYRNSLRKIINFLLIILVALGSIYCINSLRAQSAKSDLDYLLELADSSEETKEKIHAIFKLRDLGDERAIPTLNRILKKYSGTEKIYEFAAAQALFYIGTQEAYKILNRYILSDKYNAELGIFYTFAWNTEESKRDVFIEQYHLKNSSGDLEVKLKVKELKNKGLQTLVFVITVKNISNSLLYLYIPCVYKCKMLIIKDSTRHFRIIGDRSVIFEAPDFKECLHKLNVGESKEFSIETNIKTSDSKDRIFDCKDMSCNLKKPGKMKFYVLISLSKRVAENRAEKFNLEGIWSGRVVSNPVEVEIK